jgi:organic hydroperoxide reductase OsmC/OhrA
MSVKVLYTTHAVATGGRNGHTRSADGIGPREAGGFGLVASIAATGGGLSQAEAEKLVATAHQVCPYSNATRGNLDVGLEVSVV